MNRLRHCGYGFFMLVAMTACGVSSTVSQAEPTGIPMSPKQLAAPIELREGQVGFAGTSGLLWRIQPDGSFTVARFLNNTVQEPHARGQLAPAQLSSLATEVERADVPTLPEALGSGAAVNPRVTMLVFGTRTVVLNSVPSTPDVGLAIDPAKPLEARFARLVNALREALTAASR